RQARRATSTGFSGPRGRGDRRPARRTPGPGRGPGKAGAARPRRRTACQTPLLRRTLPGASRRGAGGLLRHGLPALDLRPGLVARPAAGRRRRIRQLTFFLRRVRKTAPVLRTEWRRQEREQRP